MSARNDKIDIFASSGERSVIIPSLHVDHLLILSHSLCNEWKRVASRPKRPLNSIVLDEGVKELVLEDARDFLNSKQWYADRGTYFLFFSSSNAMTSGRFLRDSFPPWLPPLRSSWLWEDVHHS